MSAGAIGTLVIYDYLLKRNWLRNRRLHRGIRWLATNFDVTSNPGHKTPKAHYFYYLYGLERAGMLYGTERFGAHRWYPRGARILIERQKQDGSWGGGGHALYWDACFAILFLRRATQPLRDVQSGKRNRR